MASLGAAVGCRSGLDGDTGQDRRRRRAVDQRNGDQDGRRPGAGLGTGVRGRCAPVAQGLPPRSVAFLVLSGLATGVSWLAYFRALQAAPASWVAPIDKLSLPLTIVLAAVWLHEPMNWQVLLGVAMMTAGSLVIWYWSAPF